jgi:alanyl-tRNA synthetase
MATRKLYHEDSAILETDATLLRQEEADGTWAVVLDRTVLFPGGGGQPADAGWIDDQEVTGFAGEADELVHYLAAPLQGRSPGDTVRVRVEPRRRRESAQQHTGQHIVSACLLEVGGYQTVSVHMGDDALTVESPVPTIPDDALRAVEECVNRTIGMNLPVRTHVVSGEELARFNLRRAASPRELHRVVEIEGRDASACGGVHVSRTGEVGLAKCLGSEKIRGNCRTIWLVGDRAYRDYAQKTELARALVGELSAPAGEILDMVKRLRTEASELRERLEAMEIQAAAGEAGSLVGAGERWPGGILVIRRSEGASRTAFRAVGLELARRSGVVALLANVEAGTAQLFACRGAEMKVDLPALLKPHLPLVRGKGGGREGVWQGSAQEVGQLDEFLEAAGAALRAACGGS